MDKRHPVWSIPLTYCFHAYGWFALPACYEYSGGLTAARCYSGFRQRQSPCIEPPQGGRKFRAITKVSSISIRACVQGRLAEIDPTRVVHGRAIRAQVRSGARQFETLANGRARIERKFRSAICPAKSVETVVVSRLVGHRAEQAEHRAHALQVALAQTQAAAPIRRACRTLSAALILTPVMCTAARRQSPSWWIRAQRSRQAFRRHPFEIAADTTRCKSRRQLTRRISDKF